MAKPPKVQVPGLNRGAGIPAGYLVGRLPGAGIGPAQLITAQHLTRLGVATKAQLSAAQVSSVFGRTGAVVAQTGDYTAAQVTNAADVTAANTFDAVQTISTPGAGAGLTIQGETGSLIIAARYSNDALSAVWRSVKSRGTIASPAAVVQNDVVGQFDFRAQATSSAVAKAADINITVIEPTPGASAMGSQLSVLLSKLGGATPTTFLSADWSAGFKVNGVVIADATGVLKVPNSGVTAGSYTSANITVGADGRLTAASSGSGGGGSAWEKSAPTPPVPASLTSFNNHVTTLTLGTFSTTMNLHGANSGIELWEEAAPATPYDLVCRLQVGMDTTGQAGISLRNSTSGKIVTLGHYMPGSGGEGGIINQNWTNPTTFNSNIYVLPWAPPLAKWLRIHNDGTTLTFYVSYTGAEWVQLSSETLASFISSADKVGIYALPPGSGTFQTAWFSWFGTTLP